MHAPAPVFPQHGGNYPLQLDDIDGLYVFLYGELEKIIDEVKRYDVTKAKEAKREGDSADSSNQIPDISRDHRLKLLRELQTLLPQLIIDRCEQILGDIRLIFINKHLDNNNPPITDLEVRKILIDYVDALLRTRLCRYLIPKFINIILSMPTLLQSLRQIPAVQIATLNEHDIDPRLCVVTPENSMIVCDSIPQVNNPLKYAGFSKLDSCIGFQIRHVGSGVTVYMHLSRQLVMRRAITNMFKQFEQILTMHTDKLFEIRIVGGASNVIPNPLDPDDSTQTFNYFMVRLLAAARSRECIFNILSVDCFERLNQIREINNRLNFGDLTVGCLFNIRTGAPILIKYPNLEAQPFTSKGNAVIVDEAGKRYYVWLRLVKALRCSDKDLLIIYNDFDRNFNNNFAIQCVKDFREAFIQRVMSFLKVSKIIIDKDDRFIFHLLDKHLDNWERIFSQALQLTNIQNPISSHLIEYLNIMANKDQLNRLKIKDLSQLPPIYRNVDIDKTFMEVLCHDIRLKLVIQRNAYQWLAHYLCVRDIRFNVHINEITELLNRDVISHLHICDAINDYQSFIADGTPLSENNLIRLLLMPECNIYDSIKRWFNDLYRIEVLEKVVSQLIAKLSSVDNECINIIHEQLINHRVHIFSKVHPNSEPYLSLDDLITKLAQYLRFPIKDEKKSDRVTSISSIIRNWMVQGSSLDETNEAGITRSSSFNIEEKRGGCNLS